MTPDAITHAIPFYQLLAAGVLIVVAVIGATWKLFVVYEDRQERGQRSFLQSEAFRATLESVIGNKLDTWADSRQFRAAVSGIVSEAVAGWKDLEDRLHGEHRRAISEIRREGEARAETIKGIHARIDKLWERLNGREEE